MSKKARPKPRKKILFSTGLGIIVIVIVFGFMAWRRHTHTGVAALDSPRAEKACHTIPAKVSSIGTYDVPCAVTVITMQYGQEVDEAGERARVEAAITSFDASISPTSLPDTGIYYLDVAPGTEEAIISYVKTQPGIKDAVRESACNYECIGPN